MNRRGGDTSSGAVPIPVSSSAMASTAASNSASATITSSNTPTGTTAASFNQQATFAEQQQQQRMHQHVYSVPIQAPGYPYYQQQQHQQGIAAASPHMQSFSPPSQTSLASPVQQHEQQRQQHHHHYQQQQQQQQGSHAYAYAASSPVGSPASPLGYLGGASPPPSHLPMPQAHTMAGLGTGSGAGYAIVGGGQVMAGSPTQAYAYYPAPGPMGPSPGGSPQMAPLSGVGNSVGGAFMAHHIPIAQRQNGASSAIGRDHSMATGAMAAGSPPPPSVALSISPPPYLTHPLDHQQLLSPTSVDVVDSRNVYIRNLPEDCTDDVLIHMSSVYGEIESSKSIIHEETGKCKGYGFVKYKTMQQALAAIEAFNMQGFQSTLAKDSFKSKLKRLQDKSSANVYISNLSFDIDEEALVELIKPYPVVSARILRDALTGQHKGAGFARMPDRDTAMLVIEKLKGLRLPNSSGPLLPRIADSEGQKQLKKQINGEGGGRFDDAASPTFVRSETTSPLMWSPVLVYSPAGSPPPIHSFDSLGAAAMSSVIPPTDGSQQMSSLQTKDHAYQHHHHQQHPQSAANAGFYAIPTAATAHYGGYMSSGYVSPVGYASPHLGYAASPNSGYISPGYLSSGGYASPVQMSGSPQAYGQFPEQPQVPVSHPDEYDQGIAPAEETGGNKDVEKRNRSGSTSNRRRNNTGGGKQQMGGRGGRRKSRGESQQTMQKMPDHGSLRELSKEIQKKLAL